MFIAYKQKQHENITFRNNTQHNYIYIMHHPRNISGSPEVYLYKMRDQSIVMRNKQ